MPLDLLLTGDRKLELAPYEEIPLTRKQVRAQAVLSGISHGTEISLFRGTTPFHDKTFDPALRLFKESSSERAYPAKLGYEWVGRVIEVGEEVEGYQVGDLVHLPSPHGQTRTFIPEDMAALGVTGPLPKSILPEEAIFLGTTSIALQAVHDAHIKVGDHVVVFGLGVLGLLAVQLARLNGAEWIDAVDPIASRRDMAKKMGADRTLDPIETDIGLALKTSSKGADVAIEFSGSYTALHQAIRSVRMAGLVVAAGFYQGGGQELRLGEEWHHNRITMVASIRGWGNAHRDHPMWDRSRLRKESIALIQTNRLQLDALLTHKIAFARALQAYELIDSESPAILKVALEYE